MNCHLPNCRRRMMGRALRVRMKRCLRASIRKKMAPPRPAINAGTWSRCKAAARNRSMLSLIDSSRPLCTLTTYQRLLPALGAPFSCGCWPGGSASCGPAALCPSSGGGNSEGGNSSVMNNFLPVVPVITSLPGKLFRTIQLIGLLGYLHHAHSRQQPSPSLVDHEQEQSQKQYSHQHDDGVLL